MFSGPYLAICLEARAARTKEIRVVPKPTHTTITELEAKLARCQISLQSQSTKACLLAGKRSVSLYASDLPVDVMICFRTAEGILGAVTPASRGMIMIVPLYRPAQSEVSTRTHRFDSHYSGSKHHQRHNGHQNFLDHDTSLGLLSVPFEGDCSGQSSGVKTCDTSEGSQNSTCSNLLSGLSRIKKQALTRRTSSDSIIRVNNGS